MSARGIFATNAWGRSDPETAEAQREARDAFRCTECDEVRWEVLSGNGATLLWPECCGQMMAILPSDERPRRKKRGAS